MPRRSISFESGQCYHVYNRGCNRDPIFATPENYLYFLSRMRHYLTREVASILAYCLMPNHYHLLVQLHDGDLTGAMHRIGVSYSKAFNAQESRVGPLFQGPFQAIHVDGDDYLIELSRYIHRNPVKAGLVDRIESWEYSSYPEYLGLRKGSLPDTELILAILGSRDRYREFVECLDHEVPVAFEKYLPDESDASATN